MAARSMRLFMASWSAASALALTLLWTGAAPFSAPAWAQNPVILGGPLTGEVVLNRDVEVRIGPSENARILRTMKKGAALNALGTPRGTSWTEVAIGGRPIGYVPADSLDPALLAPPPPASPRR